MTIRPSNSATLCRVGDLTCGACCWSESLPRERLHSRLVRHRRLFQAFALQSDLPPPRSLLLHELRARWGTDVIWAVVLRLPWIGDWLRTRLAKDTVCAFVAYETAEHDRIGCLLHPSRWRDADVRQTAAFRLLPGFGCGSHDYACAACQDADVSEDISSDLVQLDWLQYSNMIRTHADALEKET